MTITPCRDGSPAQWLIDQRRDWWDLVTRGPSGYKRYARLRFIPDPTYDGQREMDTDFANDGPSEIAQLGIAVSTLVRFTTTPHECYFLIWEGYENLDHFKSATVSIPERPCYLFRGTAEDVSRWKDARDDSGELPIPAFVWPADRAWCIANDVDPHFATIGAGESAIADLLRTARIDTTPDDPTEYPPFYGF
ncbi:hypothetical protein BJD99_00465 [Rhodococcus sp. 1163]|uniref:hypothetical protein n=1 Tax=Rhodococcus sp. 1163 TaxID=1905289 RepID=UPI000A0609CA|nr:hypothetical protein [Rhodococcus sp. 1163]ORI20029.1 hypothetical protein BJD99_00465 [Rhodococcus sp. 1163]